MARWTWVRDDSLGDVLNDALAALQSYLSGAEKYLPSQSIVRTTDGTTTTLHTQKIPVDTTVAMVGYVAARRTGGSGGAANDGAMYRVEFGAKNSSGTAALSGGAGVVTTIAEDQAGWAVSLSASGGNILVRVAGAANNNVTWAWSARSLSVKE